MTSNGEKVGTLRYAQRTDYYNNDGTGNIQYVPLFYDLFERPGSHISMPKPSGKYQ